MAKTKFKKGSKVKKYIELKTKECKHRKKSESVKSVVWKTYEKEVVKDYIQHNITANEKAFKAVIKQLERHGSGINVAESMTIAYNSTRIPKSLVNTIKANTKAFYIDHKKVKAKLINEKSVKAEDIEVDRNISYTLNIIDKETINILAASDLLWITNHGIEGTQLMRDIQKAVLKGIEKGLTGFEIAEGIKNTISELPKNKYIELFGEDKYWQMVTNTNVTRISAFTDINVYVEGGFKKYRIDTRGELACEICQPYEGVEYFVKDAVKRKGKYMKFADKNDIEGMKSVYTFGESNVDGKGETPPFHPNCFCETQPIFN